LRSPTGRFPWTWWSRPRPVPWRAFSAWRPICPMNLFSCPRWMWCSGLEFLSGSSRKPGRWTIRRGPSPSPATSMTKTPVGGRGRPEPHNRHGGCGRGQRDCHGRLLLFQASYLSEIDAARAMKFKALRQFLGHLVDHGYPLHGVMVPKTIDVDVPGDIEKADAYLKETNAT